MAWQFHGRAPVYLQIVSRMRADILSGKYTADQQIPTVRQLAFDASVNPNTMQRALSELEREGLLYAKGTVGRFITSDTKILQTAKEIMHKEMIQSLVSDALALGVSKQELIEFIQNLEEGE